MIKCPVCGKYTFKKSGDYDICPVCEWENDPIQLANPDEDGGANDLSLNEYKKEYKSKKN